ncbi:hypothetical protein ACNKHO_03990 [Shigella flexneri]
MIHDSPQPGGTEFYSAKKQLTDFRISDTLCLFANNPFSLSQEVEGLILPEIKRKKDEKC